MPVLREKHRVSPGNPSRVQLAGGGVVQASSGVTETADAWGQAASELGRWAGRIGTLMAGQAREEARAMAQAVKLNANFEPELDADKAARERLGVVAKQSYDSALEERQRQRVTSMVFSEVEKVKAENPDNVEAFSAAAGVVIAGLQEGLPPSLAGVFSDAAYTALARYGADVGLVQGQVKRRNAVSSFEADRRQSIDLMFEDALRGDAASIASRAEGLRRHAAGVRGQNLIGDAEIGEMEDEINAMTGLGGVLGRVTSENWTAAQIAEVIGDLREGGQEYGWEGSTDRARQVAANRLETLVNRKAQEEKARAERDLLVTNQTNVAMGGYSGMGDEKPEGSSVSARTILSTLFEKRYGQRDDATAWLGGAGWTQDEAVFSSMERAGILSDGLHKAFQSFANGRIDGVSATTVYETWRRMSDYVTPTGQSMQIMKDIPEAAVPLLRMMDLMVKSTGAGPDEAYDTVKNYIANPPNNAAIIEKMQGSTTFLGRMALGIASAATMGSVSQDDYEFGVTNIADRLSAAYAGLLRLSPWHTVEAARSALIEGGAEKLDEHLTKQFDSMIRVGLGVSHVRTDDVASAVQFFKMAIMHSNASPTEVAQGIVEQVKQRYPATDMLTSGVAPIARASASPEARYALPEESSLFGFVTQRWTNDGGTVRRLGPGEISLGSTWFEAWADKAIREKLTPGDLRRVGEGPISIGQGGDFALRPVGDPHARFPRYSLYRLKPEGGIPEAVLDASGRHVVLNPADDYQARLAAPATEQAQRQRAWDENRRRAQGAQRRLQAGEPDQFVRDNP